MVISGTLLSIWRPRDGASWRRAEAGGDIAISVMARECGVARLTADESRRQTSPGDRGATITVALTGRLSFHLPFRSGRKASPMPSARSERHHQTIPLWRRARRIFLLAAIACLIPAAISYVQAMGE